VTPHMTPLVTPPLTPQMSPPSYPTLFALDTQRYISLTTFRRSGAAVATPVWFVQLADTLYVYSIATAGKVKRIRNRADIEVAACTVRGKVRGPRIAGVARIVTDPQEQARAQVALDGKYWLVRRVLSLLYGIRHPFHTSRPTTPILYLAITPALPRHVSSTC
jgi:PPOX class probable F420-dependent enzyme